MTLRFHRDAFFRVLPPVTPETMSSFFDRTIERTNPEPAFGPLPVTPEYLAEMCAYLADCGPNDRNDPEAYAVLSYVEDLLAEVARLREENRMWSSLVVALRVELARLQPRAAAYDAIAACGAAGTKDL